MLKSIVAFFRKEKSSSDSTDDFFDQVKDLVEQIDADQKTWDEQDRVQSEKALEKAREFAAQGENKTALIYLSEALRLQPELVRSVGDYKEFDPFRGDEAFTNLLSHASSKLEEKEKSKKRQR